jgi:Methane oxygenase PmoA
VSPTAVIESLAWDTEQGERWFTESRELSFEVHDGAWALGFATTFTNVSEQRIVFGSPTTEGRENAGYGGLFWRGPRSFTGGRVVVPGASGGDELMGVRAPWLAFRGQHDDHGRFSTLVFVADGEPVKWFVRSTPFAAVCPAPFFDTEVPLAPGGSLSYRYTVVIADGAPDPEALVELAPR